MPITYDTVKLARSASFIDAESCTSAIYVFLPSITEPMLPNSLNALKRAYISTPPPRGLKFRFINQQDSNGAADSSMIIRPTELMAFDCRYRLIIHTVTTPLQGIINIGRHPAGWHITPQLHPPAQDLLRNSFATERNGATRHHRLIS